MTTPCPCPGHTWAMLLFKRPEAQPTGLQSQECATSSLKLARPIHHSWVGPLYFKVCGSKLLKRYNCWPVSRAKSVSIPPSLSNGQLVSTDFHAYSACYLGSKYTASKINPGDTAMTTYHTGRTDKERWRKDNILFYHPYTHTRTKVEKLTKITVSKCPHLFEEVTQNWQLKPFQVMSHCCLPSSERVIFYWSKSNRRGYSVNIRRELGGSHCSSRIFTGVSKRS